MGPDRQNMLDFGIALLVDDLSQNHRIVRVHQTGWVDLELAATFDDDSVAVEPQHAVDLTHEPIWYTVASLKGPSFFRHYDLFLEFRGTLSAAELRTARSSRTGGARTAVLVTEDEPALVEIVR
jgi:hypothetical protein